MNNIHKAFIVYPTMTQNVKLLNFDEELHLINRANTGDKEALTHLIKANILLILSIVHKYSTRCSYDGEDLVQEGILGLMKSIDCFDVKRSLRLSTSGTIWIKAFVSRAWQKQHKKDSYEVEEIPDYQGPLAQIFYSDIEKKISRQWVSRHIVQTLNTLTEPQGKMLKMYYGIDGFRRYTLKEIGQEYTITHEGVRQNLQTALDKLGRRKNIKELQHTY